MSSVSDVIRKIEFERNCYVTAVYPSQVNKVSNEPAYKDKERMRTIENSNHAHC
jgi:hypothetical protein